MKPVQDESKIDMGALRRLKILCISETDWHDTPTLLAHVKVAGGMDVNQYDIPWPPFGHLHPENAAGSSSLVEAEGMNGTVHRFLFDTGWGPKWLVSSMPPTRRLSNGPTTCGCSTITARDLVSDDKILRDSSTTCDELSECLQI